MNPINISTHEGVFRWNPAAWLRVFGSDAATFLQGQFTQELRGLKVGEARYGLWLTVKGKVLADGFVLSAGSDEFWVGSYDSPAAVIRARLEDFIIADDVVVEDFTEAWSAVTVFGVSSEALRPLINSSIDPAEGFVFAGRRQRAAAAEWIFPRSNADAVNAALAGSPVLTETEVRGRRIDAGIPAVPADVGLSDLPNEAALENDAISYTKGCYLGQEVMARLKSMGRVRRRLLRVAIDGALPAALPAPLFVGDKAVGELRSAVASSPSGGAIGLAMLSLLSVGADSPLSFSVGSAATVRLRDVP